MARFVRRYLPTYLGLGDVLQHIVHIVTCIKEERVMGRSHKESVACTSPHFHMIKSFITLRFLLIKCTEIAPNNSIIIKAVDKTKLHTLYTKYYHFG